MYRETRGEALLTLQRWSEAAAELELALPGLPARRDAYQGLAIAYENLGLREKAREQQRLAANDRTN
jgi:Tfp pilus assembly protein PilF